MASLDQDAWIKRVLGVDLGLAALASKKRGEEARQANPRSIKSTKLLLEWRRAQSTLADNLSILAKSILARQDVQDDPRFEDVCIAVAELPKLVPSFGEELADLLDDGINAGAERSQELIDKTLGAVSRYRSMLAAVPELSQLEAFGSSFGASVELASVLDGVLRRIDVDLRQAS